MGKEIDKFTIGRPGEMYSLFRVIGGTLIVLETASQCAVTVQMEYAGYKDPRYSFGNAGWLAFRSNGFLEAVILKNLGEPLAEAAK